MLCLIPTDCGRHDLVGDGALQDAVLMDACFVRERVRADDGLVPLHQHAGEAAEQLARAVDLLGVRPACARRGAPCAS